MLMLDAQCGFLARVVPPASGVYYTCGDGFTGPFVLSEEMEELMATLGAEEDARHRTASFLISKLKTGNRVIRGYDNHGNVTYTPSF